MDNIEEIVLGFFEQELGECNFERTDDLIEMGVLDSFMFVELLEYLEEKTGIQIDLSTIDMTKFNSIETIANTINGQ